MGPCAIIIMRKARVLAQKPVHFALLTDSFIIFFETIKTSILNENKTAFRLAISRTLENRAPGTESYLLLDSYRK